MTAVPVRIPNEWSPDWFRRFYAEVLSKQIETGIADAISGAAGAAGVDLAAHNADDVAHPAAFAVHDELLTAHTRAFDAHRAEADPHPQYLLRTDALDGGSP